MAEDSRTEGCLKDTKGVGDQVQVIFPWFTSVQDGYCRTDGELRLKLIYSNNSNVGSV